MYDGLRIRELPYDPAEQLTDEMKQNIEETVDEIKKVEVVEVSAEETVAAEIVEEEIVTEEADKNNNLQ